MWGFHDGMGWWMLFGGMWMLLFWGVIIALIVWAVRSAAGGGTRVRGDDDPIAIAERRYARGEITKEQLEEIRTHLRR